MKCHDCGTTERVSLYDTGRVDRETGAADDRAYCADCAEAREIPAHWQVGASPFEDENENA